MNKQEYLSRVLGALRHVTGSEYDAVRAEISGHIEDRMDALMELGLTAEEAERRAVDAMGDPEETGRELSWQYPTYLWVIAGRLAIWLMVAAVAFCVVFAWGTLGRYRNHLTARFAPAYGDGIEAPEQMHSADIRIRAGDDILYIYQVGIWEMGRRKNVELRAAAYDRFPGGVVSAYLPESVRLKTASGETIETAASRGRSSYYDGYVQYHFSIGTQEERVTVCIDRLGQTVEQEIVLSEVAP